MKNKELFNKIAQMGTGDGELPQASAQFLELVKVADENSFAKAFDAYQAVKNDTDDEIYGKVIAEIYAAFESQVNSADLLTQLQEDLKDMHWKTSFLKKIQLSQQQAIKVKEVHGLVESLLYRPKTKTPDTLDGQIQLVANSNITNEFFAVQLTALGECKTPAIYNSYLLANTLRNLVAIADTDITQDLFYQKIKKIITECNDFNFRSFYPQLVFKSILYSAAIKTPQSDAFIEELIKFLCPTFGLPEKMLVEAFKGERTLTQADFAEFNRDIKIIKTISVVSKQKVAPASPVAIAAAPAARTPEKIKQEELDEQELNTLKVRARHDIQTANDKFVAALIDGYKEYCKIKSDDYWGIFSSGISKTKAPMVEKLNPSNIEYTRVDIKQFKPEGKYNLVLEFFKYVMSRYNDATPDRLYLEFFEKLKSDKNLQYINTEINPSTKMPRFYEDILNILRNDLNKEPIKDLNKYFHRLSTLMQYFPEMKFKDLFNDARYRTIFVTKHLNPYLCTNGAKVDKYLAPILRTLIGEVPMTHPDIKPGFSKMMTNFQNAAFPIGGEVSDRYVMHALSDPQANDNALVSRAILGILHAIDYKIANPADNNPNLNAVFTNIDLAKGSEFQDYLFKYKGYFISQINESLTNIANARGADGFDAREAIDLKNSLELLFSTFNIDRKTQLEPKVNEFCDKIYTGAETLEKLRKQMQLEQAEMKNQEHERRQADQRKQQEAHDREQERRQKLREDMQRLREDQQRMQEEEERRFKEEHKRIHEEAQKRQEEMAKRKEEEPQSKTLEVKNEQEETKRFAEGIKRQREAAEKLQEELNRQKEEEAKRKEEAVQLFKEKQKRIREAAAKVLEEELKRKNEEAAKRKEEEERQRKERENALKLQKEQEEQQRQERENALKLLKEQEEKQQKQEETPLQGELEDAIKKRKEQLLQKDKKTKAKDKITTNVPVQLIIDKLDQIEVERQNKQGLTSSTLPAPTLNMWPKSLLDGDGEFTDKDNSAKRAEEKRKADIARAEFLAKKSKAKQEMLPMGDEIELNNLNHNNSNGNDSPGSYNLSS